MGWNRLARHVLLAGAIMLLVGAGSRTQGVRAGEGALPADFLVNADFSSPLPLLVVEQADDSSPAPAAEMRAVVRLVARTDGRNRPDDPPALQSAAILQGEGGPWDVERKMSCSLRLVAAGGGDNPQSLLGMPVDSIWSVCGSESDRSMLRNALGRELARHILDGDAPAARHCEVLVLKDGKYLYQGIHLLSERVAGGAWLSGRALEDKRYLARMPAGGGGRFELVYSSPDAAGSATGELLRLGAAIDSKDLPEYFKSLQSLDADAFVDTYCLVLALMNDVPGAPYFWYENDRGRVGIVPSWDFDKAMGGGGDALGSLRYPWLGGLLRGKDFVERLKERYFSLRRGVLSPERLDSAVDGLFTELREPLARDWRRWDAAYTRADADGDGEGARSVSPEQEKLAIKHYLRMQGEALKTALLRLHWDTGLVDTDMDARWHVLLAFVFLVLFFLVTVYVRRRW